MSDVVIDASVAAAWMIEDEQHPIADAALEIIETDQAIVPQVWHFEIRNVLIIAERRGRIPTADIQRQLQVITALRILTDQEPDFDAAMDLARSHNLTFYDALYLELAKRRGARLATLDNALARAAANEGYLWSC